MPVIITSKRAGFCRCGIAHPAEATVYPDDKFREKELKQLQAEPMLVVQIVPAAPAAPASGNKPTVADTIALVQAADAEELDRLAVDETRKGVIDAIAKRRAELQPA